jgi:hypothetical protein
MKKTDQQDLQRRRFLLVNEKCAEQGSSNLLRRQKYSLQHVCPETNLLERDAPGI